MDDVPDVRIIVSAHTPVGHADTPDTERDTELEAASDETTVLGRRGFGLEDGDETGCGADTETGEETGDENLGVGIHSGCFDGGADKVDEDKSDAGFTQTELAGQFALLGRGRQHSRELRCFPILLPR